MLSGEVSVLPGMDTVTHPHLSTISENPKCDSVLPDPKPPDREPPGSRECELEGPNSSAEDSRVVEDVCKAKEGEPLEGSYDSVQVPCSGVPREDLAFPASVTTAESSPSESTASASVS